MPPLPSHKTLMQEITERSNGSRVRQNVFQSSLELPFLKEFHLLVRLHLIGIRFVELRIRRHATTVIVSSVAPIVCIIEECRQPCQPSHVFKQDNVQCQCHRISTRPWAKKSQLCQTNCVKRSNEVSGSSLRGITPTCPANTVEGVCPTS